VGKLFTPYCPGSESSTYWSWAVSGRKKETFLMQSVCANRILNPARGSGAPELGSAVSSPSEVWGGAPADIEFGAIESQNLAFRGPQRPSLPGACAGIWGAKAPIWGGNPRAPP